MKSRLNPLLRISAAVAIACIGSAHAADITLGSGTYTDTQTYNNGTISGPVTFNSGANYTFDSLNLPLAWNRVILNSGAALNVGGNVTVDFSGVSLNGGTLTAGGLLLHDSPNWAGSINDGKQTIEQGDSIINGATLVANQSNANFISFIGSSSHPEWNGDLANNLWLGNDGATINSNGFNIGITMALGNFSGQTGSLTKTGAGTVTLTANNSYAGGTTVNGGVLEVQGSNSGNSYIRGTVTVNSGAELRYTGGDGTGFGFANKLDTITINGGLVNSAGTMTHLWGAAVNMTGGELRVNNGTSSPTGDRIEWFQSTVNTSASANTATISGRVNLRGDGGGQIAVFNVAHGAAATDLLVSAAVTESFGSVGITKNGAGTMELSGTNSYLGATQVTEGKLLINGNNSAATGAVTVASGATLGGSGTIGGTLTTSGTIAPGNSIGTLSAGTTTWNGGDGSTSIWEFELGAGNTSDKLAITGDFLKGTGSTFKFDFMGSNHNGTFSLVTWTGTTDFDGIANDLLANDVFTYSNLGGGRTGSFSFSGNSLTFTAVPEPTSALAGLLITAGLLRRRHR